MVTMGCGETGPSQGMVVSGGESKEVWFVKITRQSKSRDLKKKNNWFIFISQHPILFMGIHTTRYIKQSATNCHMGSRQQHFPTETGAKSKIAGW